MVVRGVLKIPCTVVKGSRLVAVILQGSQVLPLLERRDKHIYTTYLWSCVLIVYTVYTGLGPTTTTSYDRNYITERRARQEFLLEARDMEGLRITHR